MALSQRLEVRQSQALVMTPHLMQAIKLLQLSRLDLAAYVEGEIERNPLLERTGEDEVGSASDAPASTPERDDNVGGTDWINAELETSRSSIEQGLGTELENVFPDDSGEKNATGGDLRPGAFSEWPGGGTVAGACYNLAAVVSADTTHDDDLAA